MSERTLDFIRDSHGGGAIRAIMPDMAIRNRLKPFVFLDHFTTANADRWGFGYHPHSGVGTFTYTVTADLHHEDTGGEGGVVPAGAVQWMAAGNGIWHQEYYQPTERGVFGLQLWLQLPPELENAPTAYQVEPAERLPIVGPARILAGKIDDVASPMRLPWDLNYFWVQLKPGEHWRFDVPDHHDVAWLYLASGALSDHPANAGQLAVYRQETGAISLKAGENGASFALGTAQGSALPIVASRTSMHSSQEALDAGAAHILELGSQLRAAGKI